MSQVKISKIELTIGSKKVDVTLTQAKELQEALNDIFGNESLVVKEKEYVPYYPYVQPYIYNEPIYNPNDWYTICGKTWSDAEDIVYTDYLGNEIQVNFCMEA